MSWFSRLGANQGALRAVQASVRAPRAWRCIASSAVRCGKKFTSSHEWISLDDGRVGISEHAASELGDVVFVELPEVGTKFSKGDAFGSLESVKAVSDVYAPISGTVVKVNKELNETPSKINDSPEEEGWLIEMDVSDADEAKTLMERDQYIKAL